MIWYLCLSVSAAVLLAAALLAFHNKKTGSRIGFLAAGAALAAYILYIPVYFCGPFVPAFWGSIINLLQVISLDADYFACQPVVREAMGSTWAARVYLSLLGILHSALPVISVVAIIGVFFRMFARLRLAILNRRRCPLFVFAAQSEEALCLAEDIERNNKKNNIIFASSEEPEAKGRLDNRRWLFTGTAAQEIALKTGCREIWFFCMSGNEDRDLSDALALIGRYGKLPEEEQARIHIVLISGAEDVALMLDSTEKGLLDIRLVDPFEDTACRLLDEYPLYRYARNGRIRVLMAGLTPAGRTLFKTILWYGQMKGFMDLSLTVAGTGIDGEIAQLRLQSPELFTGGYDLRIISEKDEEGFYQAVAGECADADYVIVDEGEDSRTLQTAIRLRRLFYTAGGSFDRCPPVFAKIADRGRYDMIRALSTPESGGEDRISYRITPFGDAGSLYTFENLVASGLDLLALNIHLAYTDVFAEGEPDVRTAVREYRRLHTNIRSSRANAMHIRCKLAMLGLDYEEGPGGDEAVLDDVLTQEKLELLARAEHDRWMAFHRAEGWRTADVEQVRAYKRSGLSADRHKCLLLKMHPDICEYDELKERSEALGLPDATVYDRELIRRIPEILHDRWGITGRHYRIVRRERQL